MAKFLYGNELNAELEKLFRSTTSELLVVSPYIKMHDRVKSDFRVIYNKPEIRIVVVFGKNEEEPSKSLGREDLSFLMEAPNIEIRYARNLHAKYYANETTAILTSMNLYDYSQNNNIEAGVMLKGSLVKAITGDALDGDSYRFFKDRVIPEAELIFHRVANFKSGILGIGKSHGGSVTVLDKTPQFFGIRYSEKSKPTDYQYQKSTIQPEPQPVGYCIRTGVPVPFNPERPMSEEAFRSWSRFGNPDYAERFCHFSGEESNGETSYGKPIMRKNWQRARQVFKF